MNSIRLLFLVTILLTINNVSSAKHDPTHKIVQHFYSFYDDGGEHPANSCEIQSELPRKLKKEKALVRSDGYIGSEQTDFSEENEATINAWMHYFSTSIACDKAVKESYRRYETGTEPPVDSVKPTSAPKQSAKIATIQKSVEALLECVADPRPAKTVLELQEQGIIEKKYNDNIDSISYFKVAKSFEVWGMKVSHVSGFDYDTKLFGRAPGAAPFVTFGVVVPYPLAHVKQKLESIAVTGPQVRASLQNIPSSKGKQVLTEIACESSTR